MDTFSVWDSFNKSRAATDATNLAGLQQATGVATLAGHLQKLQQEKKLRETLASLGSDATPDQISAAVRPFASASEIFKSSTDSETHRLQREANKQTGLARLQQVASLAELQHQDRLARMTDQRQIAAEVARHNKVKEELDQKAMELGGARADAKLLYETGMRPNSSLSSQLGPQAAPPARVAPTVTVADLMKLPPEDRAAALAGIQNPPPALAAPAPAAMPSPAPTAAPEAPPVAPAVAPQAIPPQGDMRDVMAARGQFGTPPPAVAPAPASAAPIPTAAVVPPAPAAPVMPTFTGSPKEQNAAKNKWLLEQAKPSAAGNGLLSDDALTLAADQYISGDPRAATGYARDIKTKSALMNRIAERAKAEGIDGKLLAAIMGEYEGFRAGQRVLGTREAQLSVAADVTSKFVPIAIEASEKFDRTGYKTLNDVQIAVQSRTASSELRRFAAANNALINVYARAINPQGVATVSDKDHAREILATAFSKGDYRAGAEQLKLEVDTELQSPGTVKRDMRSRFTGSPQRRESDKPSGNPSVDALLEKYK